MSNEIEALRSLLVIVQTTLQHLHGSPAYEDSTEALCGLLSTVRGCVLDLESKVAYQLQRSDELDRSGLPKVSRLSWLRSTSEIEAMRQKIRDARGNLQLGINAIDLHIRYVRLCSNHG